MYVAPEQVLEAYNSYLHYMCTPTVLLENVPAGSSLEEQMEKEDELEF